MPTNWSLSWIFSFESQTVVLYQVVNLLKSLICKTMERLFATAFKLINHVDKKKLFLSSLLLSRIITFRSRLRKKKQTVNQLIPLWTILCVVILVNEGTRAKPSGNKANEILTVYLCNRRVYRHKTPNCSLGGKEVLYA